MTLIASLLLATALVVSVAVIILTICNAMPRITEIIETEFAPTVQTQRRIMFGEVKGRGLISEAQIIAFPRQARNGGQLRLAA